LRTKILITVKTYPTLSSKYNELVCTAGFKEDGTWVRIYPIPFRKMDFSNQYKKYQWIEINLTKNLSDPRPESYRPIDYKTIVLGERIDTDNGKWTKRKELVLKKIYYSMSKLILEAKTKNIATSLAVLKPKEILDFTIEETSIEWDKKKLSIAEQMDLFEGNENPFKIVKKLPYKFSYIFKDGNNKKCKMMIEDWEIGQLYWNCLKRHEGNEIKACEDVRKKYYNEFVFKNDLYFFLGTTKTYHFWAPNPFIIIGVFYPLREKSTEI